MSGCGHGHECGGHSASSVHQTLDEMEFERGIWSAAMNGETDEVVEHLSRGASVDKQDKSGFTALHYACRNGHTEVCRMLLRNGANSNALTRSGSATPMHRAAYRGHLEIVQLLVSNKGCPDLQDNDHKNALHKAAEGGQEQVLKRLLADFPSLAKTQDIRGKTPKDIVTESHPHLLHVFDLVLDQPDSYG